MNISLTWLNQYLDRPVDADEAERVLTDVGFPLDGREATRPLEEPDELLDVEVTSNRGDCLSHVGVAREIAAATGRTLQPPEIALPEPEAETVDAVTSVDLREPGLCPVYTARVIRGVSVGPSPAWLRRHMEAIGLRPVNNVVDITNFVLHELGQPLHAFDLNLLNERRIVVRRAGRDEPFTAIDGSSHRLSESMLVIADANEPVAVAGVMGGRDSEVTETTTDLLLESARFDPLSIRATSRTLKLASDSSYRFERGVDPAGVERASQRAAQLIVQLAGGRLAEGVIRAGEDEPTPAAVTMRPERCRQLLGYDIPDGRMTELLAALELQPESRGEAIHCTVPSHRLDLQREVDLIEEVARLNGYGQIPMREQVTLTVRRPQDLVRARRRIGAVLVAHGYHETVTFAWAEPDRAKPFLDADAEVVQLDDDRRRSEPALRPSVLPSLLQVRKTNQDAGNDNVRLFEIAKAFDRRDSDYRESAQLALLTDAPDAPTVRGLRGTIEELLEVVGLPARIEPMDPPPTWAEHAGRIVDADQPDRVFGELGRCSDAALKTFDLKQRVDLAWLDYAALAAAYPPEVVPADLPRFPAIERDLSLIVDESVRWRQVASIVAAAQLPLLEDVRFVTTYRGKQVGKGRKSVTLRLHFRDPQKTLRHDEVDPQMETIVERFEQELDAELRSS